MKLKLFGPLTTFLLAAILFLGAAVGMFVSPGLWLPIFVLAVAGMIGLVSFLTQTQSREDADKLLSRQSHIEYLQSQVQEQQNSVDALADGLDVAIFICDPKGIILYSNRRAMEMFRFEEPMGKSVLAVTLSYDLERLALESAQLQASQKAELRFTFPEERVGLAKAWTHQSGKQVFLSIYEITDLRRLERIRQDFVANVSHELRTPMTIIRSMAETLYDGPEIYEEKGPVYLERIIAEVDRLSMISNDLLILSAAESNIVRKHASDIAVVARTVVRDLSQKAIEKGLLLSYHGPETFLIEANGSQMTQVVMNLVENAINYTINGQISVELKPATDSVEIDIEDTGLGIASDQLPRIFERFYRVDKGRSRATGGTGLGLSIVKHIVEAHSGTVKVRSELHKGSCFTIGLPIGNIAHEGDVPPSA